MDRNRHDRPRAVGPALAAMALAATLVTGAAAGAAPEGSPLARVRTTVDAVLAVLGEPGLDRDQRWERIAEAIGEHFDFQSMSQSVLASSWQRASAVERRQFTEYFSQYIEVTFRSRIESYAGQGIEYLGERTADDRAVVDTVIVSGDVRTPVTYRLRRADTGTRAGQWLAYDVVIEGVSLVANYRNTFAAIVKSEGMEGLLADVRRRIEKHRGSPQ